MSVFVNDGGVEKETKMIYVNDGGIDKLVAGKSNAFTPGTPMEGGYFFGYHSIGPNDYALIVADKLAETSLFWKVNRTETPGTLSEDDGWANTIAMNDSDHPAAKYCREYSGGGFTDWYLAAINELNLLWVNLAPGINYRINFPPEFSTGGAQALDASGTTAWYWSSTQTLSNVGQARVERFSDGNLLGSFKNSAYFVRPIRRVKI